MDNKWFAGSYQGSSGHSITSFLCANTLQSHPVVKQPAAFKEWYNRLYFSFHLLLSLFELGAPSSCWSQNSVGTKNWETLPFSRSHGSSLTALDQPCYVTFKTSPFITRTEGGWPLVQEINTYIQPKPALNRFESNRAFKRQTQMIIGKCFKIIYKLWQKKKKVTTLVIQQNRNFVLKLKTVPFRSEKFLKQISREGRGEEWDIGFSE